jgi:adenosylmethionine-8-amino-7-oxononanoate aminotransferase
LFALNALSAGLPTSYPGGSGTRAAGRPLIGSVRGVGLMVGLEMVKDLATRAPDAEVASKVKYAMLARRILISTDGASQRARGVASAPLLP